MAAKKALFFFPSILTLKYMHWIKMGPTYVEPQGPLLSAKASFVRIDTEVWALGHYMVTSKRCPKSLSYLVS